MFVVEIITPDGFVVKTIKAKTLGKAIIKGMELLKKYPKDFKLEIF